MCITELVLSSFPGTQRCSEMGNAHRGRVDRVMKSNLMVYSKLNITCKFSGPGHRLGTSYISVEGTDLRKRKGGERSYARWCRAI